MSRYWAGGMPKDLPDRLMEVGAVCLPLASDDPCGDGWAVEQTGRRSVALVTDDLGHGIDVADAAREAVRDCSEPMRNSPSRRSSRCCTRV